MSFSQSCTDVHSLLQAFLVLELLASLCYLFNSDKPRISLSNSCLSVSRVLMYTLFFKHFLSSNFLLTFANYVSLAMSYSHRGKPPTTIGAKELNDRVRHGNGCDLFAITTRLILFTRQKHIVNK